MRASHRLTLLAAIVAASAVLHAQSGEPSFDAVSIKRNTSASRSSSMGLSNGLAFNMTNVAMLAAVSQAYPVKNQEIVGAPDWLRTDRYDVVAKAPGKPTDDEVRAMLRTMLKERLRLAVHIEQRDVPVYALVVVRTGYNGLKPFTQDCDAIRAARETAVKSGTPPAPPALGTAPPCGYSWSTAIYSGGITMETVASMLGGIAGRAILDRTGLTGRYEFTLRFAPPGATTTQPDDPPDLFTALQEQLGLKLDAQRAPLDTLIIDHVERPDEN